MNVRPCGRVYGGSLSPGSYRLSARAKDAAGRSSPAKNRKFKVVSP
jgi:hypothetical protein